MHQKANSVQLVVQYTIFGGKAQITLNQVRSHKKRNPNSSTPSFTSNETLY